MPSHLARLLAPNLNSRRDPPTAPWSITLAIALRRSKASKPITAAQPLGLFLCYETNSLYLSCSFLTSRPTVEVSLSVAIRLFSVLMLGFVASDHLPSSFKAAAAAQLLGNLSALSTRFLEKDFQQSEKLAIVYATPPLSPSAQRTAREQSIATLKGQTGMDSNDHRRQRPTNPSGYPSQQSLLQTSPQYSSAERFRNPQLPAQSPTSAPTQVRSGNIQGYSYQYGESSGFAESSIQAAPVQAYPAQYGQDTTTQRLQQPYQQYGSNIMYNVPAQSQQAPQSPYESVQPYSQQRGQASAVEALQNLGVPQQYFVPGQEGPTSAPNVAMAAPNVQGQYAPIQTYTSQSPVGREPLSAGYVGGMSDPSQSSSSGAYGGQASYSATTAADMDTAYAQYETELRRTFEAIRDGRIAEAGRLVVNISDWLLTNAELLGMEIQRRGERMGLRLTIGLVRDDEPMYAQRLKMWDEFNTCWLSVLQKQREMTQEMVDTGQQPQPPQSLMDTEFMEGMGKEIVRLCDMMEKHGLVDYQMGVWEEEIITREYLNSLSGEYSMLILQL